VILYLSLGRIPKIIKRKVTEVERRKDGASTFPVFLAKRFELGLTLARQAPYTPLCPQPFML
jgi:hypothetical protein